MTSTSVTPAIPAAGVTVAVRDRPLPLRLISESVPTTRFLGKTPPMPEVTIRSPAEAPLSRGSETIWHMPFSESRMSPETMPLSRVRMS